MSRRKTNSGEIHMPEHYFSRYIAKEILHNRVAQRKYDDFFCSLDEKLSSCEAGVQHANATNLDGSDLEKQLSEMELLSWIDYIEMQALHQVLRQMNRQHQLLLTYRFHHGLTQRETAKRLGCAQSTVARLEKRLLHKLEMTLRL